MHPHINCTACFFACHGLLCVLSFFPVSVGVYSRMKKASILVPVAFSSTFKMLLAYSLGNIVLNFSLF